jgi:hypothetical protein
VALIDPDGLFNGQRLRQCSNMARLFWPYMFLASNTYGRFEVDPHRIITRAFTSFRPVPSQDEIMGYVQEYRAASLLFIYEANGQIWGQWDAKKGSLPTHNLKADRESPPPPPKDFEEWRSSYRLGRMRVVDNFGKISDGLKCFSKSPYGIGVGIGVGVGLKPSCPSGDGRAVVTPQTNISSQAGVDQELFDLLPVASDTTAGASTSRGLSDWQLARFSEWWATYWLKVAKKTALDAFKKKVKTQAMFGRVMAATGEQSPEMLTREPGKRPHGATWLNAERWEDELTETVVLSKPAPKSKRAEIWESA